MIRDFARWKDIIHKRDIIMVVGIRKDTNIYTQLSTDSNNIQKHTHTQTDKGIHT